MDNECNWMPDEDGVYHTECDEMFVFEVDGPKENSFRFCCFCGKNLVDCTPQE